MQKDISVKTFEDFIALRPENIKIRLEEMWQLIANAIPAGSEEVISYQIPTYKYKGFLVGFGNTKTHISFYIMSTKLTQALAEEFKPYKPQKSTIAFAVNEPFPTELIYKIIELRVKENEAAEAIKSQKKTIKKQVNGQ